MPINRAILLRTVLVGLSIAALSVELLLTAAERHRITPPKVSMTAWTTSLAFECAALTAGGICMMVLITGWAQVASGMGENPMLSRKNFHRLITGLFLLFLFADSVRVMLMGLSCELVRTQPDGLENLAISVLDAISDEDAPPISREFALQCVPYMGEPTTGHVITVITLISIIPPLVWVVSTPEWSLGQLVGVALVLESPLIAEVFFSVTRAAATQPSMVTILVGAVLELILLLGIVSLVFFLNRAASTSLEQAKETVLSAKLETQQSENVASIIRALAHDVAQYVTAAMDAARPSTLEDDAADRQARLSACLRMASRLLADALDVGAASKGHLRLVPNTTNVCEVVNMAVSTARGIGAGRVEIEGLPRDTGVYRCIIDEVRLEQVLLNALSNAAKHTSSRNLITVTVNKADSPEQLLEAIPDANFIFSASPDLPATHPMPSNVPSPQQPEEWVVQSPALKVIWLYFRISDAGSGLRCPDPSTLFATFSQHVEARPSRRESESVDSRRGRGIGLATVLQIVSLMGGAVGLRDRKDAPSGTIFEVAIPARIPDEIPSFTSSAIASSSLHEVRTRKTRSRSTGERLTHLLHDKTVAILDDEPVVRQTLNSIVASLGSSSVFDFADMDSFTEAIPVLPKDVVILTDFNLTDGRTGIQAAEMAREGGITGPIVLVSGDAHHESDAIDAIVDKPFTREQVRRAISDALLIADHR